MQKNIVILLAVLVPRLAGAQSYQTPDWWNEVGSRSASVHAESAQASPAKKGAGSVGSSSSSSASAETPPAEAKPVFVSACTRKPIQRDSGRRSYSLFESKSATGDPAAEPPPSYTESVRQYVEGAKWFTQCAASKSVTGQSVFERRTLAFSCDGTATLTIDVFANSACTVRFESAHAVYAYSLRDFSVPVMDAVAIDFSPISGSPALVGATWKDIISARDVESNGTLALGKFSGGARPSQWNKNAWRKWEVYKEKPASDTDTARDEVKKPVETISQPPPAFSVMAVPVSCESRSVGESPSGLSGPAFQASYSPKTQMNRETGQMEYVPAKSACSTPGLNPFMTLPAACRLTGLQSDANQIRASLAPIESRASGSHVSFDPRPVRITDPSQMRTFSRFVGNSSNEFVQCREAAEIPGTFVCMFAHSTLGNLMLYRTTNFVERLNRRYSRGVIIPGYGFGEDWGDVNAKGYANAFDLEKKDLLEFYNKAQAECAAGRNESCLNAYEKNLFNSFILPLAQTRENFVILGVGYGNAGSLSHEIIHAQYFLRPEYRAVVDCYWETELSADQRTGVKNYLEDTYDTSYRFLMINEFQAYVLQRGERSQLRSDGERHQGPLLRQLNDAGISVVQPAGFEN